MRARILHEIFDGEPSRLSERPEVPPTVGVSRPEDGADRGSAAQPRRVFRASRSSRIALGPTP
jgi:hypothetical protein